MFINNYFQDLMYFTIPTSVSQEFVTTQPCASPPRQYVIPIRCLDQYFQFALNQFTSSDSYSLISVNLETKALNKYTLLIKQVPVLYLRHQGQYRQTYHSIIRQLAHTSKPPRRRQLSVVIRTSRLIRYLIYPTSIIYCVINR